MKRETRTEYGKQLLTRLTNEKSASDYRIPPKTESSSEGLKTPLEDTDVVISHYINANTALIEENMKLKKENEYLQQVLGELRNSINNLDELK